MPARNSDVDRVLRAQRVLTKEEHDSFLQHFYGSNPRWKGCHVADALDTLVSTDAHLEVIEPLLERVTLPSPYFVLAVIATIWIEQTENPSMERILDLERRCLEDEAAVATTTL